MNYQNDELRIKEINELLPPVTLLEKFPLPKKMLIPLHARKAIHNILKGNDDRLLVVIGPCSIRPCRGERGASRLLTLVVKRLKASWKSLCASILKNRAPPSVGRLTK